MYRTYKFLIVSLIFSAQSPIFAMNPDFLNRSSGAGAGAQEAPVAPNRRQGVMSAATGGQVLTHDIDESIPTVPNETKVLHLAAVEGRLDNILSYLKRGAQIDIEDAEGNTPLMAAIASKQGAAAILLLRQGADSNKENGLGLTPLDVAIAHKLDSVIAKLKEFGGKESTLPDDAFRGVVITRATIAAIEALSPDLQEAWEQLFRAFDKEKNFDTCRPLIIFCRKHKIPYYESDPATEE